MERELFVADLTAGGPGELAGLQKDDVVQEYDGVPILGDISQLLKLMNATTGRALVNIRISRRGTTMALSAKGGNLGATLLERMLPPGPPDPRLRRQATRKRVVILAALLLVLGVVIIASWPPRPRPNPLAGYERVDPSDLEFSVRDLSFHGIVYSDDRGETPIEGSIEGLSCEGKELALDGHEVAWGFVRTRDHGAIRLTRTFELAGTQGMRIQGMSKSFSAKMAGSLSGRLSVWATPTQKRELRKLKSGP